MHLHFQDRPDSISGTCESSTTPFCYLRSHMLLQRFPNAHSKQFALLIDPDRHDERSLQKTATLAAEARVDFLFVGSSLLLEKGVDTCVRFLKKNCSLPVILFPGNTLQLSSAADGILFLSLISGRNPELLIGQHVVAAPFIRQSGLEVLPTGYILVDSGAPTSASYMSQTMPLPHDKDDIAAATALAGEMLGLKHIYLDAGSGARYPVRASMIQKVRETVKVPLIVGGGIRTPEKAIELCSSGADILVVGNSIEENPSLIQDLTDAIRSVQAVR